MPLLLINLDFDEKIYLIFWLFLLIYIEMRHCCHQMALVIALELIETPNIFKYLLLITVQVIRPLCFGQSIGVYGYRKSTDKSNISSQFNYCPLIWICHSRKSNNEINKVYDENSELSMVILILVIQKSFRKIILWWSNRKI